MIMFVRICSHKVMLPGIHSSKCAQENKKIGSAAFAAEPSENGLPHLDSKDLMLLMLLLWWMSLAPKTNEAPGKTI